MRRALFALAVTAVVGAAAGTTISCMDESGSPVDWFVILKHSGATTYMYADVNSPTFALSSNDLSSKTSGAVAKTIVPALKANFAMYNDEVPNNGPNNEKYGHTKGVVGLSTDGSTGFWLVHSVPQAFAEVSGAYQGYPSNGVEYGQSMLCLSLTGATIETLASSFRLTRPQWYDSKFSTSVESKLPDFVDVVKSGTYVSTSSTNITAITTTGGNAFTVFAKNTAWANDLYSGLVAPNYGADIWCETWQNGAGNLDNFCTPKYKENTFNIYSYEVAGYTMTESDDHSKIGIMPSIETMCVGDINRQSTQYKRGGGTVCFKASTMVGQINKSIVKQTSPPRGGCAA